ncbi:cytochrome-c peroxidase [Aestuariirhabdus litorea]|uniref:Cytochrome-c peroxidase n=1 Tax=Aestuariirhabdus litorea TaxID=2528527 RepID=A0A3P3VWE2_9GAMM|nr:cytochrome c peroxidase [Aestuariirhabdus litorea]RRJ85033.1 cytochrome-c peroxidase [Aestuariirhabdus litorea]RWW98259.1 cytochrome-c peroxidase [Endozoicomonadaceae bacterium GTF-13]
MNLNCHRHCFFLSGLLLSGLYGLPAVFAADGPSLQPLGAVPIPADNPQTEAKVELGKLLFFDPRLGGDASIACAGCHEPDSGWAWSDQLSRGYAGTVHWRNSQTIVNSAYYPDLFWAGSSPSLEKQAPSAAKGAVAGNGEDDLMEARLAVIPEYRKRFREVFGDEWPLISNAWKAIAAFERTLVQTDTPLDRYLRGETAALTDQQLKGKRLFEGKAGCIQCHNGPMASDFKYHNIGVPPSDVWEESGIAQVTFRYELYAKGMPETLYRRLKDDPGAYFRGKNSWDMGKFRTPSLRYTAYTAPYMHNGAFYTLEEVIDFYDRGGYDEQGRSNEFMETRSSLIRPLGLSESEKADLLAFLEAFSGEEIGMEKPVLPEYAPRFTLDELKSAQEGK